MENKSNYVHWYYDPEATIFFKELINDINQQTENKSIDWTDSCYHNDTCGSVCFNYDNDGESYVQLWAFHNEYEANREDMARYLVTTYIDGKEVTDGFYITDDRQEAINQAISSADKLLINR
jgi:hypothetical protein